MLKNEKLYIGVFILVLLCVNPPILSLINSYAKDTPLTWGYPTLWIWLQFWYGIGILFFVIGAALLPSWNKNKYKAGDIQ